MILLKELIIVYKYLRNTRENVTKVSLHFQNVWRHDGSNDDSYNYNVWQYNDND